MGRRIGLLLLVLFAGCDAEVTRVRKQEPEAREPAPEPEPTEPQQKDPIGPLPQPSHRTIDVRVVLRNTGGRVPGVDVVSNMADGPPLDRQMTDADGNAVIEVETGGTVSVLWEDNELDEAARLVSTYVVTDDTTLVTQGVLGVFVEPNPPVELVLEVEEVADATLYVASISCLGSITVDPSELPIVVPDYRGCPGSTTFSVLVEVLDTWGAASARDAVFEAQLPPDGSVTQAFSPTPQDDQVFGVTFDGLPLESYVHVRASRSAAGFYTTGNEWTYTETSTEASPFVVSPAVPEVSELPIVLTAFTDFSDGEGTCFTAYQERELSRPLPVMWQPGALATWQLVDDTIALGPGVEPDIARASISAEDAAGVLRNRSLSFPFTADQEGRALAIQVELPADLEALYGFEAGTSYSRAVNDVLVASGYASAIAASPLADRTWLYAADCP